MDELTKVTEEVVTETEVTEETTGIGAGTVATGVCALTGALAIAYGAYKGAKWVASKVKAARTKKEKLEDILEDDDFDDFDDDQE